LQAKIGGLPLSGFPQIVLVVIKESGGYSFARSGPNEPYLAAITQANSSAWTEDFLFLKRNEPLQVAQIL
jgi:hypothetical protein